MLKRQSSSGRIDILTKPTGVDFEESEVDAKAGVIGGVFVRFIGLSALLKNKRACGRDKDLMDVRAIEALGRSSVGRAPA